MGSLYTLTVNVAELTRAMISLKFLISKIKNKAMRTEKIVEDGRG